MNSTRLILAWLHLLALAIGPAAVWARARALRQSLRNPHDAWAVRRALTADAWWGVAAVLWLATGLWRLLGHTEKTTSYYLTNPVFYAKMAMFLAIVAMEIRPMMTLMRWRAGKAQPNPRDVGRIEVISYAECALVIAVVFAAVTMARGYGTPTLRSLTATIDSLRALGDPPEGVAAQESRSATGAASVPAPTGSAIATDADLQLLSQEIAMPIAGIDPAKLKSSFNDLRGATRHHEALDIMSPRRTPVLSAAKGRLIKLFTSTAGGLMVYAADSSERFILMYGHLDEYAAGMRDGIALDHGELIGYVGSTGNALASAPHLHFAIARSANVNRWWMGTPVDPLPVLQRAANAR